MEQKREQALVGLFVLIAAGVLLVAIFTISGALGPTAKTYHSQFTFTGGIEPGAVVRYAGGPKIGRVEQLRIDPQNPSLVDVTFSVKSDFPVKTDSKVKIMSISPLGDNHLEVLPGSKDAGIAAAGSLLPSVSYVDFNALAEQVIQLTPQAQQLIETLNTSAAQLKGTLDRVNDLLSPQNRANLSAGLADVRGLVHEIRPQLRSTLDHVDALTQKVDPLLQDFRATSAEANRVLTHVDELVGEDRPEIRQAVIELRGALKELTGLTAKVGQTLDVNSENVDELLDNLVHVTENLKEFTATIKARPYTLIRSTNPREHKPGDQQ
jgi:phospholipid/cholesterol/gamma-HCH transport system substrate-binding protein